MAQPSALLFISAFPLPHSAFEKSPQYSQLAHVDSANAEGHFLFMASASPDFKKPDGPPRLQEFKPEDANSGVRALPSALGPERSILSSMMQEPAEFIGQAVEEHLTPEHFYVPAHGTLYKVLLELYEKDNPIELVSLTQTLADRKDDRIQLRPALAVVGRRVIIGSHPHLVKRLVAHLVPTI